MKSLALICLALSVTALHAQSAVVTVTRSCDISVPDARDALVDGYTSEEVAAIVKVRPGRVAPTAQDKIDILDCTLNYIVFDTINAVLAAACSGLVSCATGMNVIAASLDPGVTASVAAMRTDALLVTRCHGSVPPVEVDIECSP